MKNLIKRVLYVCLAFVMAAASYVPAYADSTKFTVYAPESSAVMEIYQVATGSYDDGTLSNLVWGQNAASGYTAGSAVGASDLSAIKSGANIVNYINFTGNPIATITGSKADGTVSSVALDPGYYAAKNQKSNAFGMFELVKDTQLAEKATKPTVTVRILENSNKKYQTIADAATTDLVDVKVTGTVPSNLEDFATYPYKIIVTPGRITKSSNNTVTVKVGSKELTKDQFNIIEGENGTFTVSIPDIKKYLDENDGEVELVFKATLNKDAELTFPDNNAEYNPNGNYNGATAYIEYQDIPSSDKTAKSNPDTAKLLTYALSLTKIDDTNAKTKLAGVEFIMYRLTDDSVKEYLVADASSTGWIIKDWNSDITAATTLTTDSNGQISVKGFDGEKYYIHETKAASEYALPAADAWFNYSTGFIETVNGTDTTTNVYWVVVRNEDGSVKTTKQDGKTVPVQLANNEWVNLPTGGQVGYSPAQGTMSLTMVNQKKNTVSTGGIGNTIFYMIGGIVVLAGAVWMLYNKKKQKSN